jgi:hypothetical protein
MKPSLRVCIVIYLFITNYPCKDICFGFGRRLQWSSGSHAGLWFPSSRIQTRPKPLDFFLCKKSSACLPPEGNLNNLSHVPTLRHVKEPSNCGKLRIVSKIPSIKSSLLRWQRALAPLGAKGPLKMNAGTTLGVGYNQL